MASLKEVFVEYSVKTDKAVSHLKLLDKAVDQTVESLGDVEDKADDAGEALVDSAKKGESAWKRFGDTHDKVTKKLGEAKPYLDFGKSIASGVAIGAAALTGLAGLTGKFVNDWAQGAQVVERTAAQYGLSTDALQEWQFAVKSVGGDAESVGELFKELGLRLAEVGETGTGSAMDALSLLKIDIKDIRALAPEKQMELIADKLAMISDVGARTFIKDSLFGGEFEKVGNILELGSKGIGELRKEAQALGGVLSGSALRDAAAFRREMTRTETVIDGIKNTIGVQLLPVVQRIIAQFREWALRNKDLIATRLESFVVAIADGAAKLGPLLSDGLRLVTDIVGAVGGVENAILGAAGAWAVWQAAALAATGPVGAAVAGIAAGSAAIAALADRFLNAEDRKRLKAQNELSAEQEESARLATRAAKEAGLEQTYDPDIDRARRVFFETALAASKETPGASASELKRINAQVKAAEAALDAAYEADRRHAEEVNAASQGMRLGKIAKPGEIAPITASSEIKAAEKKARELERDRKIREQLEGLRFNAEGPRRAAIESALRAVNQRITGGAVKGPDELIAELVGQGTGLGGGALRPTGLGTSINNIDASIHIDLGGVDVEIPRSLIDPNDPRGTATNIGEVVMNTMGDIFGRASKLQVAQIYG